MRGLKRLCAMLVVVTTNAVAQPEQAPKIASLSYSPSGIATETEMAHGFPESAIRADLQRLVPYTGHIRTYSVERGLDRVPAVAKDLGLKVSLGIWLNGERARNMVEVEKGIKVALAYPGVIDRVFVGNEAVLRGDLIAAEVVAHIARVKTALVGRSILVGTAEPWDIWLKNPRLAAASDFIGAHVFPYWDGVPQGAANAYLDRRVGELQKAYPDKPLVIAETGWPWKGAKHQAAIASPAEMAIFTRQFLQHAKVKGYDYNIVDAYDQLWKVGIDKGTLWGILNDDGTPKFDFGNSASSSSK